MTDLEFLDRAELLLKAVELACDRINDDGEADIDNLLARATAMQQLFGSFGEAIDFSIAKHCNGPTGAGQLYFVKDQTRFVNLVRERNDGAQGGGDSEPVM